MTILLIVVSVLLLCSVVANAVLWKGVNNVLARNEAFENILSEFYSQVTITIHNMRVLDEKRMFQEDDEVGQIFSQLVDAVNDLRPLIYGSIPENDSEETSGG